MPSTGSDMTFHVSAPSADHLKGLMAETGAFLTVGARSSAPTDGAASTRGMCPPSSPPTTCPTAGRGPARPSSSSPTASKAPSLEARSAAGPSPCSVHGAQTIQQCLDAGLLDEIHIDLAAVLLGTGVRLFDHLANTPAVLGNPTVVTGVGVTHLRYPVHPS